MQKRRSRELALSLVELLISVGVIAILAAIAFQVYSGTTRGAAASVAWRNLNYLNGAVVAFNNGSGWSLPPTAQAVFTNLQATDPDAKGSPYLPVSLQCAITSSTDKYRAVWNGTFFQMLNPGASGTGIDLLALGSSLAGTP